MARVTVTDGLGVVDVYEDASVRSDSDEGGPSILVVKGEAGEIRGLYNEGVGWLKALVDHG
ncbi:UNVERIFIED_ORG: hypothetical protein M2328_005794 [Rhodococcus erythropolis]